MLLRRVIDHVRKQEWTAIAIDFIIVVVGVYTAVWVQNFQNASEQRARTAQVVETLRNDISDSLHFEGRFGDLVESGLVQWELDFEEGKMPPPFFFRMPGSEGPPGKTWDALLNMRVGELLHPSLVFELAFFYSEREGVAKKYERYIAFVEGDILPKLKGDASAFYVEDGSRLRPEYAVNLDLLADWIRDARTNSVWAACLDEKLDHPDIVTESCIPAFNVEYSGPDWAASDISPAMRSRLPPPSPQNR
jgi:hypothetical protein